MKKWQDETDLIRMVTDAAMKQSSRRGFFAHLGKAGLVLASVVAGFGIETERTSAAACNPIPAIDGYVCPGDVLGVCDYCSSACVSGGCKCVQSCSSGLFCFADRCSKAAARCYWVLVNGNCYFGCTIQQC